MIDPKQTYELQDLKSECRADLVLFIARWRQRFKEAGVPKMELTMLIESVAQSVIGYVGE